MMKKINLYIILFISALMFNSCEDELNTEPTDRVSGPTIFKDAKTAQTALNGLYRCLYVTGWSTSWGSENPGHMGVQLYADLLAEDHLMREQGSGWFFEEYRLNVHADYNNKSGRPYAFWNYYYTLISNVNYILANEGKLQGDPVAAQSIMGQAYAMRAFSYYYLIQLYQQTIVGHEKSPGVPLYLLPTVAGSQGKVRGTVADVYAQINSDIDTSIKLLTTAGKTQDHCSHIDYYVANGLKARFCLTQHKYTDALAASKEALSRSDKRVATVAELGGNNSAKAPDALWAFEIIKDQSQGLAGFFAHMDADGVGLYGSKARQCISSGLYNLISDTDLRKTVWFRGSIPAAQEKSGSSMVSYCQTKFKMADYSTRVGDYIFMKVEEMLLIKAESECQLDKYVDARATIALLGSQRDSKYAARLASLVDSKSYNQKTNDPIVTLMDEILLQRRVELWGESGRIFDLQRLALGYNRTYVGSNHTQKVTTKDTSVASPLFILPLPQSEFDGNGSLNVETDQNPIVI